MPCSAVARGMRTGQAAIPPFTIAAGSNPAFNDLTDNTPCGRRIISTANGVNLVANSLCLFHLMMKLGQKDVQPPYVDAP